MSLRFSPGLLPICQLVTSEAARRGPPFYKFGASVKYDLLEVYERARERRFSSTSDVEAKMAARDGGREPKASV
jgi:hypothetical protein